MFMRSGPWTAEQAKTPAIRLTARICQAQA